MEKQLNLHNDCVPCHMSLTAQQFFVRPKFKPSHSHHILQISLCATSGPSRDLELGSKVTVLHPEEIQHNMTAGLTPIPKEDFEKCF